MQTAIIGIINNDVVQYVNVMSYGSLFQLGRVLHMSSNSADMVQGDIQSVGYDGTVKYLNKSVYTSRLDVLLEKNFLSTIYLFDGTKWLYHCNGISTELKIALFGSINKGVSIPVRRRVQA